MNAKAYHKLLNSQKQKTENEMDYFKKKMSNKEQLKIMNDLGNQRARQRRQALPPSATRV
jgi:hypothetical protein